MTAPTVVAYDTRRAAERVDDPAADTPALRYGVDLVATLGLTAYSIVVSIGFSRVFTGWDFFRDLVLICLVGHGSSYVLRRLRAPVLVAIPLVLVVLTWLVAWIYYPDTFSTVFPLAETWESVRADFRTAADQFQTSTAPVPYEAGWAFMAGATTGAAVWLADTFAFRAQARGEALVPGAVLFVFIAALGVDEHRVACSLAVIGAGFCALALLRQRTERRPRTALGRTPHPLLTTLPAALAAGAVVMAGAWIVAPHLPGADDEPLFDTRGDSGATEIVSPLVDIRSRLVNQAEDELFTVVASAPSYWRVAALPEFGDDRWDLPDGILDGAEDQLNAAQPGSVANVQEITITGLRGSLVPVAPEPVRARGPGATYESLSSALFKAGSGLDDGDVYDVTSAMPRFTPDQLRAASSADPPDSIFTELPDDLPPEIAATAAEVTASSSNAFEQMVLLQDWFRTQFTYSTDVPEGNGTSAIVSFLENRIGYCEQFAGTFAVMARTLGLPSRVAVGFTQGEQLDDASFVVRGRNAHAWPEVWFDGLGWVPFEPTPGRGLPGAEAYTGVAPVPDPADQAPAATTTTTTVAPTTTTVAGAGPQTPTTTAAGQTAPTTTVAAAVPPFDTDPPEPGSSWPWLLIAAAVIVVGGALAAPALVRRWRRSRRKPTSDPAHMLLDLWDRALAALGAIGFRPSPAMTPLEVSDRAATTFPPVAEPLHRLAAVATTASFAPYESVAAIADADRHHRPVPSLDEVDAERGAPSPAVGEPSHDTPHDWCAAVERAVEDSLTVRERVRRYFTVWR